METPKHLPLLTILRNHRGTLINALAVEARAGKRQEIAEELHSVNNQIDRLAPPVPTYRRPIDGIISALKERGAPMDKDELISVVSQGNRTEIINVYRSLSVHLIGRAASKGLLKEIDGKIGLGEWK